jgi:hypothetical protein
VNLKGEPATVGKHCGANRYEVTPEVVAFYADALDDHNPLWSSYAPPLLHHSECYKHLVDWYLKNLSMTRLGAVRPIPIGVCCARVRPSSTAITSAA